MYEKLLPIPERTDLSKMGLFSFVNNGNVEQYVPLSQYLKAIYVIKRLENPPKQSDFVSIYTGSIYTDFSHITGIDNSQKIGFYQYSSNRN